jgi:hypothetical protein
MTSILGPCFRHPPAGPEREEKKRKLVSGVEEGKGKEENVQNWARVRRT